MPDKTPVAGAQAFEGHAAPVRWQAMAGPVTLAGLVAPGVRQPARLSPTAPFKTATLAVVTALIAAGLWAGAAAGAFARTASPSDADLCDAAATRAAARTGVPLDVLQAVALTETGRKTDRGTQAWPWAVHLAGKGHWPDSEQAAVTLAETALAQGATNIDLGCFQLNIRWHASAFTSVADMMAPENNARYAAEFLARLYTETGDWSAAAAAYHSRTPDKAAAYRTRFETNLARIAAGEFARPADRAAGTDQGGPVSQQTERPNLFPLLQGGEAASPGSLMPMRMATRALIGG